MLSTVSARDIAVIGQQRGDDVDRAGALLDRLPRLAIGLHAAKDIFGARRGRIIVDVVGVRDRGARHEAAQRSDNRSYPSNACHGVSPGEQNLCYRFRAEKPTFAENGSRRHGRCRTCREVAMLRCADRDLPCLAVPGAADGAGQRHPAVEPDDGDHLRLPALARRQERVGTEPDPERQGQGGRSRRAAAHHRRGARDVTTPRSAIATRGNASCATSRSRPTRCFRSPTRI